MYFYLLFIKLRAYLFSLLSPCLLIRLPMFIFLVYIVTNYKTSMEFFFEFERDIFRTNNNNKFAVRKFGKNFKKP